MHVSCCAGNRGNVNYDAGDVVNILDVNYFQAYFFSGGPPPPCTLEADVNGSGGVNILDFNYLVNYFFNGGTAPVACP